MIWDFILVCNLVVDQSSNEQRHQVIHYFPVPQAEIYSFYYRFFDENQSSSSSHNHIISSIFRTSNPFLQIHPKVLQRDYYCRIASISSCHYHIVQYLIVHHLRNWIHSMNESEPHSDSNMDPFPNRSYLILLKHYQIQQLICLISKRDHYLPNFSSKSYFNSIFNSIYQKFYLFYCQCLLSVKRAAQIYHLRDFQQIFPDCQSLLVIQFSIKYIIAGNEAFRNSWFKLKILLVHEKYKNLISLALD